VAAALLVSGVALILATVTAGASQSVTADPPAGAVSGVVLDRSTGAPLAGASVSITARAPGGSVQRRHMTDPRGRFVAADLPPSAEYRIVASKPGYFEAYYGPPDASNENARPVAVAAGQWVSDIEIRLTREGIITGRVTDEDGEAVVGATVRTLTEIPIAGRPQPASGDFTKTDDRGEYRIPALRAGRYVVFIPSVQHSIPMDLGSLVPAGANRPEPAAIEIDGETRLSLANSILAPPDSGAPRAYPAYFFPDARTIEAATRITVGPGHTETADMRLRPVPVFRVSGSVQGEGVSSGLILRLVAPGLEDLALGSEVATSVVDDRGRFSFVNVPAGRYRLEGRRSLMEYRYTAGIITMTPFPPSPAYSPGPGGGGDIASAPPGAVYTYSTASRGGDLVGSTAIDVAGRDLSGVVLPMRRAVRISGRVEAEPDDAAPAAPPAFRGILQSQPANGSASLGMTSGQIGPDGRFEIGGLLAGPYVLRLLGGTVRSITWAGKDVTHVPFDGSLGQDFTDVVITTTRKTTAVTGSVRRQTAGSTAVVYFPVDKARWTNFGLSPVGLSSIGAATNGTYRVALPAGDYYVIAVDARHGRAWQDPALLARLAPLATRVVVDWGETRTLDLSFTELP
jgi:hypothetical protein